VIYLTLVAVVQVALIAFLLHDRRVERREAAEERAMLMLRIQAPEVAVQQQLIERAAPPTPVPVGIEDDQRFNQSREEMLEALMRVDP
jgi:hypothetical protein